MSLFPGPRGGPVTRRNRDSSLVLNAVERQLTHAPHGHILTNTGVWSPDGAWIIYDIRSDPAGAAFDGTRIERVNVRTGEVQTLYESLRGAHCGVASCSPVDDRVAFILGPEDPTPDWRYAADRRRGVIVDANRPGEITNLDARDLTPPFTPGALRGGSHVHVFSGDGRLVSFTYEDHVLASLRDADASFGETRLRNDLNQRNVAVALPRGVRVPRTHPRNHDGAFFSAVVTTTVNNPRPGSDEINRAYEDAWIGADRPRSIAFFGDLVAADGRPVTELFVVDLPDDLTRPGTLPLEGTPTRRPAPPLGAAQRRLTFTADRAHGGIHGPRHWPRSSPDGLQIAVLMRDDRGTVQLWTISPRSGPLTQVTRDPLGVASAYTWNAAGTHLAYIADGSAFAVEAATGRAQRLTPKQTGDSAPRPEACVFSPNGKQIAYVRSIATSVERFNQIFVADAHL
jgi:hypothetical protein